MKGVVRRQGGVKGDDFVGSGGGDRGRSGMRLDGMPWLMDTRKASAFNSPCNQ